MIIFHASTDSYTKDLFERIKLLNSDYFYLESMVGDLAEKVMKNGVG